MALPFQGQILAAGSANAFVVNLNGNYTQLLLEISGGYTGAGLVFEATPVGSSTWFPIAGIEQDTLSAVTGTSATPLLITPDGQALGYKFDISGVSGFRVWASQLSTGPIQINGGYGSFFANPPSGATLSYPALLAILWQLQHMTFLVSQLDEKVAALFVQNPLIPPQLPKSIWDVTG